jgi:hypothetical protein
LEALWAGRFRRTEVYSLPAAVGGGDAVQDVLQPLGRGPARTDVR